MLSISCTVLASTPATAAPLDKGHFDEVTTDSSAATRSPRRYPPARKDLHVNFRSTSVAGRTYSRTTGERVRHSRVHHLDTGGTYTEIFTSNNRDHKIVDNGDGTITIFSQGSGSRAGTTPTVASS